MPADGEEPPRTHRARRDALTRLQSLLGDTQN
jgi:hypothetical protein